MGLALAGSAMAELLHVTRTQATFAPDGAPVQSTEVALPHRWDASFPGRGGRAVYRFELPASGDPSPRALYLPRIGNQFEVWLDGKRIHQGGVLGDDRTDHGKAPVWVPLPELEHATGQRAAAVEVRLSAQATRWGGMSAPWVGPRDEVRAQYLHHYHQRQYGALVVCAMLALMTVTTAGFWWSQRDRLYMVFCLGSAAGLLRIGDRLITQSPLPWPWWGMVSAWALVLHLVLMVYFALMLVGDERWLETRWFRTLVVLDLLLAAAAFLIGWPLGWTLALATLIPVGLVAWFMLMRAAWRRRTAQNVAVALAGALLIGAAVRDWLLVRVLGDGSGTPSILAHSTMLFVLLMGIVLVQRFARVAAEHRALLATLDARVREREAELRERGAQLREELARQAALQERQRLMHDIHDGVGAQLSSLLNLLERDGTPRALLREHAGAALDELRMAVDSLQPVHGDLTTVLATLRYRLQPRLDAAGIVMDWRVDALPRLANLGPSTVLQLQRVLQEAFTNAMRHAGATRMRVRAFVDAGPPERLVLSVEDDGRGIAEAELAAARGLGLDSMRARAQALGAQLQFSAGAHGGTLVRLSMPLQVPESADPDTEAP